MSVVVLISAESDLPLIGWAWQAALRRERDLLVIEPLSSRAEPEVLEFTLEDDLPEGEALLGAASDNLRALRGELGDAANITLKKIRSRDLQSDILREIYDADGELLIVAKQQKASASSDLARALFDNAACEVVLARLAEGEAPPRRNILVPVSGGSHAVRALELADQIGTPECAITALYVEPEAVEFGEEIGERVIEDALKHAKLSEEREVAKRVVLANRADLGIAREAENYDLIIIGASEKGHIRRQLFGTVPDRLLSARPGSAIAVVRGAAPLADRIKRKIERWLDLSVPQLDRRDRIELIENLQRGSRWNFDFMALIGLSTAIAGLGLLQDSTAVVIGAMLVAPLMTPLLGAGLALVQANQPLLLAASRSIIYGFLFALLIGIALVTAIPIPVVTTELAGRGEPSLLDMFIGFLSGLAAAYCVARPTLSAALPGVAIAAALVPPIATVGISLGMAQTRVAQGAALLFATNVVAIILGAALSFYAGGVRSRLEAGRAVRWARRTILGLILCAVVLAVPLASVLLSQLAERSAPPRSVSGSARAAITQQLAAYGAKVQHVERLRSQRGPTITIKVESPRQLPKEALKKVAEVLAKNPSYNKDRVRIETLLVMSQN